MRRPQAPADLTHHSCLKFAYNIGQQVWQFNGRSEERVSVSGPLRANSSQVLREAAVNSMWVILMPSWLVGEDLRAGRLQAFSHNRTGA
ncbi:MULTISPECIES: LysR substrate-binding domain-containing protein [Pseudomonas]|jgi:DNA-binding transcriptional LysR family regulator|uniref:LysR substrate-binding domain-containing protein n=1 Tax=Pseudomonas TaxID=286 RepID=UPI0033ACAF41